MNDIHSFVKWRREMVVAGVQGAERKRIVKPAEQRKDEILSAALELFKKQGFSETTVGDIAGASGVASGTVYLYFPSKDHILLALHQRFHEGLGEVIAEVAVEAFEKLGRGETVDYRDGMDRIVERMGEYVRKYKDNASVCIKFLPGAGLDKDIVESTKGFVRFLTSAFEQARAAGLIHVEDPEMTAHLINNAIGFTMGGWAAYREPADLDRILAATKELLFKALAPLGGYSEKAG